MQQFQAIFQKTFSEYERLLNRIQGQCDETAATQIWQEHLNQTDNYLRQSLPDEYQLAREDRDLCEVYFYT